jgi:hypothetical protein
VANGETVCEGVMEGYTDIFEQAWELVEILKALVLVVCCVIC